MRAGGLSGAAAVEAVARAAAAGAKGGAAVAGAGAAAAVGVGWVEMLTLVDSLARTETAVCSGVADNALGYTILDRPTRLQHTS